MNEWKEIKILKCTLHTKTKSDCSKRVEDNSTQLYLTFTQFYLKSDVIKENDTALPRKVKPFIFILVVFFNLNHTREQIKTAKDVNILRLENAVLNLEWNVIS